VTVKDADQINRLFAQVQKQFGRRPCRDCKSRETVGTVYEGIVIVSCSNCGSGTPVRRLATRS
jgi:translation initiation factor 2 beta subunit (eIF-2beta)/eIF-5